MLKTKKDIDKHVADILGRLKSEQERNMRGYNFAKHYYNIKEYEAAKRYLSGFLSYKETAPAHKLMGQIHEQFGHLEKAVQSYKRSLELDGLQKEVVLKLCELYCQIPVDPERARYWADRAEQLFPHHEVVFRLRESLVNVDGDQNTQELEDLITNELTVRPRDVKLRIKLLKLYLDMERVKEAYNHAVQVEEKRPYPDSLEWYYCLSDIYEAYLEEQNHVYDQQLCIRMLSALDRLVYLNIISNSEADKENYSSSLQSRSMASSSVLLSFDLHLLQATKLHTNESASWRGFLDHMKGQLYFHMAMIILKKLKLDHGSQKEACRLSAVLLLSAYSFKVPNINKWDNNVNEDTKMWNRWLYSQANYRLSQSGHVILGMCREDKSKWLGKIREQICLPQIKDKIYQRVFNNKSQKNDSTLSYFMHSNFASEISEEFPDLKSLMDYDLIALTLNPSDLHHVIWVALQHYVPKSRNQPMFGLNIFKGLQYSHAKMENPSPESLCILDVEAFLYAAVRCSARVSDEASSFNYSSMDAPTFLPAGICRQLCTDEQSEWWSAAYQLFSNTCLVDKVGEARRRLQHGIEVIRAIGNHGMHVNLVVFLARLFAEKVIELKSKAGDDVLAHSNEIKRLEGRAELYWKAAIDLLEKVLKNISIRSPKDCLFPTNERLPSFDETNKFLEEGNFFLACQAMNNNRLEDAIAGFETLSSPYAAFYQALAYKKLAAEEFGSKPRESITSEMRSRHVILLTQARGGLYRTLDRIGNDHKHPLNQMLPEEIEYIETRLARIDPDTVQRPDCLASEESYTQESEDQDPDSLLPYPVNVFADLKGFTESTPKPSININSPAAFNSKKQGLSARQPEHVRPSPERLDAQIKSLANWHDTVLRTLIDQNKNLMETNRAIVEELKQNKSVVEKLTFQLVELNKNIPVLSKLTSSTKKKIRAHKTTAPSSAVNNQVRYNDDNNDDDGEEEAYYDGYYYHDDDSDAEESNPEKLDVHENPAYAYPNDNSLNNSYRFGQGSGYCNTSNFVYPSPQPGFSYYPAAQGLSGHQSHISSNNSNVVHGHSAQTYATATTSQFYNSRPPAVFTGLPFSEGQKLPEFHFNIESQVVADGSPNSIVYGKSVNEGARFNADDDSKFRFMPMKPNETANESSSIAEKSANNSTSLSSAFLPTATVPHAFQIPMPQISIFSKDSVITPNVVNVTSSSPTKPANISRTESESYNDEDSFGPDFKPVIPLPAEIEVKTGEEDEKILFEDRAKLYRFVAKEWKERGVGVVKILQNEKNDKIRLLMRRDQIFKICANHYILPDMILKSMKNNEQTWIWAAQDFSDGQVVHEQFCIKFKTVEIGRLFKQAFDSAKDLVKSKKESEIDNVENLVDAKESLVPVKGFGDQFKPKSGSWNCTDCYLNNASNATQCVACGKQNPAVKPETTSQPSVSSFQFGFSAAMSTTNSSIPANSFEPSAITSPSSTFKFGITNSTSLTSTSTTPPNTGFKFGFSNSQSPTNDSASTSGFVFGKSPQAKTSGFVFGASNMKSEAEDQSKFNTSTQEADDSKETEQSKFTFGGFTFKTSPTISTPVTSNDTQSKPTKAPAVKNNVEPNKPNPFSNFSFVSTDATNKDGAEQTVWGSNSTTANLSFSAIANNSVSEAFKETSASKVFVGSGEKVFDKSPSHDKSSNEDFESTAQFKPVIPLPELVNVCTGEEDEEKVFGERAKLFRFNSQTKEWKERGIGELKIMKNKITGRMRILMRRDQVLKICANHYITEGMKLQPMSSSDAAWIWVANDFSEGELQEEKLAAKFKTPELAKTFRDAFENALKTVVTATEVKTDLAKTNDTTTKPLSEIFKPAPGSWKCTVCEVRNDKSQTACAACLTAKPEEKVCEGINLSEMFKPEIGSWKCSMCFVQNNKNDVNCVACSTAKPFGELTLSQMFKPEEGSWKCSTCLLQNDKADTKCVACLSSKPGSGAPENLTSVTSTTPFKFGISSTPKKSENIDSVVSSTSTGFSFGIKSPVFQFGGTLPSPSKVDFEFGTLQTFNFSFGIRPKSPAKTPKSPVNESATEGEAEDDTTLDSEGDSIYFHPVIPLPDKVDVRTGEEDEDILYSQPAKLFRWADGEWKERGVGDFKILCHKSSKKIRLFMRRKAILKVCCNHYLTPNMDFSPKDDRSWMWVAKDYADQELKQETLVLRFKSAELAQTFKTAVDEAKTQLVKGKSKETPSSTDIFKSFSFKPASQPAPFTFGSRFGQSPTGLSIFGPSTSETSDSAADKNEVQVIEEKLPEDSLKLKAISLKLPPSFYNYEAAPQCPGCRGCSSSDEETDSSDVTVIYEKTPTAEQIKKAEALSLPRTFYLYEDKTPCPGCRGCQDFIPQTGLVKEEVKSEIATLEKPKTEIATLEKPKIEKSAAEPVFGARAAFTSSSNGFSFADLSQKGGSFLASEKTNPNFKFVGAGSKLFNSSRGDDDDNDNDEDNEDAPDPSFKPVIPLPQLVDVRTGEEDEDKLFGERCKLYRYDPSVKQWKERGVGEMKVLRHRTTTKCRILMRREQVHKIVCNQSVSAKIELKPFPTSENAWSWIGNDFSEERYEIQHFAVRFKTKEIADHFHSTFIKCQKNGN